MKHTPLFILLFLATGAWAQPDADADLHTVLKAKDSLLFQVGFNTCNLQVFEALVSHDFEFYHDEAGITASKQAFVSGIKNGLCRLAYQARRELDEASVQVFPLKKGGTLYGAIQNGRHRFYALENGKPQRLTSEARFTHLWLLEQGEWKLSRGLSFDHLKK